MMIKDQISKIKELMDKSYENLQTLEYSVDIEKYVRCKLDTMIEGSKELLEFVTINAKKGIKNEK